MAVIDGMFCLDERVIGPIQTTDDISRHARVEWDCGHL